MPPLKSVIFDYGNVLCHPQPRSELSAMAAELSLPVDRFEDFYWRKRLPYDRREMTPEQYWQDFCQMAGVQLHNGNLGRVMALDSSSWSHGDPVMVDWAMRVRDTGLRTAILSNMPLPLREHLDALHPWIHRFDYRVFSCDVRMAKPSPAIYQRVLAGLGVAPEAALFLDDRPDNVRAARDLGINALLFTTPAAAAAELSHHYHLPPLEV